MVDFDRRKFSLLLTYMGVLVRFINRTEGEGELLDKSVINRFTYKRPLVVIHLKVL